MIRPRRSDADGLAGFAPVLATNLLPVAGVLWLGWNLSTLYLFYWVDLLALLVVYAGCSLFAQGKIVTDGRRVRLPGIGEDGYAGEGWLDQLRPITVHGRLPPVYPRNVGVVAMSLVFGLVFLTFGYGLLDTLLGGGRSTVALQSPMVLGSLFVAAGSHVYEAHQRYFEPGRYESLSPQTVLDVPLRVVAVLGSAMLLWMGITLFSAFFIATAVSSEAATAAFLAMVYGGWFAIKIGVEWGRFSAEQSTDPGWLARLLAPEDPHSDAE
ncbi:DUF6498-containing protein [Halomicrobium salinisoli]|uniref:DUF6498-containing protein n=1 Tax=Halomicrobium salinisoli TaxID=2878391 RepID=UPI001CF04141|nr:DUF6498-containing protein [Halomicrobium salinisoli]